MNINQAIPKIHRNIRNSANDILKNKEDDNRNLYYNPYDEYMYFCNFQAPPKVDEKNQVRFSEVYISGQVDLNLYRLFLQINYDFFMDKSYHCVDEIRIYFSSPGGDAYVMLQIINFILKWNNEHPVKLSIVANGMNASAAIPIILCGARRYAFKNSLFMLHDISVAMGGFRKYARIAELMHGYDHLRELYFDMILSYSSISEETLADLWTGTDLYVSAEEALNYGLIDEIIELNKVKTMTMDELLELKAQMEKEEKNAKKSKKKSKATKKNKK